MPGNNKCILPSRMIIPAVAGGGVLAWFAMPWQPLPALAILAGCSALLACLLVQKNLLPAYMKTIAFLLPFSTPLPFLQGSMIRIPTEPMIGLAIIILPMYLVNEQRQANKPHWKETVFVLPLFGAYLLSTLFSEMLPVSLKFSFVNIAYILVFYVLLLHLFRKHPGLFPAMAGLYGVGLLLVWLWSLHQYAHYDWNPLVMRGIFRPFYNDHTIFGASAAMLSVLFLGQGMRKNSLPGPVTGTVAGLLFAIAVVYSTSRGALLGLLFAAMLALILALKPRPAVLATGFAALLLAGILLYPVMRDRMLPAKPVCSEPGIEAEGPAAMAAVEPADVSSLERLNRWVSAWRMFRERPLTGFGPGTYQFVYIPYQDERLMNRLTVTDPLNPPEGSGGTAHSEYLLLLSETGIAGLMAFLLLMGRWSWLVLRRWRDHPKKAEMGVALAALSTYVLHALVNNFLTTDKFAFLFWGTAAWLVARHHADGRLERPGGKAEENARKKQTI